MLRERLDQTIRDIPDFPKKGILFKDITPIFQQHDLVEEMVEAVVDFWKGKGISAVAGIEARGFLIGPAIASKLKVPFIPIRKAGKLPADKIAFSYDLEYGSATIEMHADAVKEGDRVLVHDDLLATGGTAAAAKNLLAQLGAEVGGYSFMITLGALNGKKILQKDKQTTVIHSLIEY